MTALAKDQKMSLLRLATVLQDLHDLACDPGLDDTERTDAARQLATAMNSHFSLVITGLRSAGGARRP